MVIYLTSNGRFTAEDQKSLKMINDWTAGQIWDHLVVVQVLSLINRYRRKRPKVDASIFDSALSHTRRSDSSEKREKSVSTFGRLRLWANFESSPVSVNALESLLKIAKF